MYLFQQIRYFLYFLRDLVQNRTIIFELTKQDFRSQYLGSYLGLVWAFVHPTITILIFWFVFQYGIRSQPVRGGHPFVLWLMAGMIPWFFITNSVSSATRSIIEKSYLVKKVVFRVSILPIIKILSALLIHLFFIAALLVLLIGYGYRPSVHNVQALYYLFAMIIFVLGLTWLTSSLTIFMKDIEHIVGMALQFGFWMTPIFWSLQTLPDQYQKVIALNPFHYIVQGYRDSLVDKVWFWEHPGLTLYFWSVTLILFVCGALVFRALRPHFPDVL